MTDTVELVGAINEHTSKLEGLRGKTQYSITVAHHLRPHVVEGVGKKREGADVLDRILGGAPRVSYFAQISDGQKAEANKSRYAIAKRSGFISS